MISIVQKALFLDLVKNIQTDVQASVYMCIHLIDPFSGQTILAGMVPIDKHTLHIATIWDKIEAVKMIPILGESLVIEHFIFYPLN